MTELNNQVLEEASTWFVEFRTNSLNSGRQDEFMDWLRRSPEHIRAYLEVSRTYVQLPGEGTVPLSETERLLNKARARPGDTVVSLDSVRSPRVFLKSAKRRAISLPWTLAASLLLVAVGAFLLWSVGSQRGLYITEAGEERSVALADGSRIQLNGRTRLRVAYSAKQRDVRLIDGQALFQVAKDKSRPFVVDTGTAIIRAVGTEFDVQQQGTETTVSVLEGTVAVLSSAPIQGSIESKDLMVTAGEQAIVTILGSAKPKSVVNVAAATAWTRGQLEFDETPLVEVAEEFNRSSPRPLKLSDASVGLVRISGIYSSVDPESLILFLRSQADLKVTESSEQIVISSKLK